MTKILIVAGIFLISLIAAIVSECYEHGYGDGYADAMKQAEEIYRKEKADGNSERNDTELH